MGRPVLFRGLNSKHSTQQSLYRLLHAATSGSFFFVLYMRYTHTYCTTRANNFHNECYRNSAIQVLFRHPPFAAAVRDMLNSIRGTVDVNIQHFSGYVKRATSGVLTKKKKQ